MEKSNLIAILRTFDKKEIRELRKWLNSPAHNLRQDVIDLYEYLMAGQHLHVDKYLTKERVFKQVFPDKTYNDNEMRQCIHFLFKAIESYLAYNELFNDEVRSQTMLAKVYRRRQLPKLFKKAMDTSRKIQQQQPYRNHQYYEDEYAFQFEQYTFLSGLGRSVPYNLQEVSNANDTAYLANKLQLSCFMVAHQAVFKTDYDMGMLQEILQHLESDNTLLKIPAIAIYYYGFKAITNKKDESNYQRLKEQIDQHSHLFPDQELRVILLMAINYCISMINAGKNEYYKESFSLYKKGLSEELFLENGVLSRFTFSNAAVAGLNLREYDWVEEFIRHYSQFLAEEHREVFVQFYLARMYYEKKDYGKAMRLLAQSDYDDILMTISAKVILLKIYYETDEYDALDWLLASLNTYLQRKKVMGYHKTNYKNIIKATKKLLKTFPNDREQKEKLKKELTDTNPLTEKKWLLEQLEKM